MRYIYQKNQVPTNLSTLTASSRNNDNLFVNKNSNSLYNARLQLIQARQKKENWDRNAGTDMAIDT